MSQCAGTFALLFTRKKTALLPCFCNILKANCIWLTLTRLTKHQKATRGHVCFSKKGEEMNEWTAITKFHMSLESLKLWQERRFWVSGKSVVLCTLNAPDFFGKTKARNRLHIMWGSVLFFFFYQDKELQLEMNSNRTFWAERRNDPCPPCHFRNSCGLENITLIKSERQKILSIFIYKNTWEYKKVAKQWGYRLKTEWIHWYLQFLLVRRLMLHLGEPQDSQCRVKKRKKSFWYSDILWSLPSAPCKARSTSH